MSGVRPALTFDEAGELNREFQYGPWIVTKKTDTEMVALADRHYSRQKVGAPQFTRPGKNLVLRTADGDAVWVSWKPWFRKEGLKAWENTVFRNESKYLSSDLIKWRSMRHLRMGR